MRQIEFRGKEIDTGGWVFGYYVKKLMPLNNLNGICHYIYGEVEDADGKFHNDSWEVIPETVGQYTGLRDVDNRKVYEGDIIQYENSNAGYGRPRQEEISTYTVPRLVNLDIVDDFYIFLNGHITGNIHDKGETNV